MFFSRVCVRISHPIKAPPLYADLPPGRGGCWGSAKRGKLIFLKLRSKIRPSENVHERDRGGGLSSRSPPPQKTPTSSMQSTVHAYTLSMPAVMFPARCVRRAEHRCSIDFIMDIKYDLFDSCRDIAAGIAVVRHPFCMRFQNTGDDRNNRQEKAAV